MKTLGKLFFRGLAAILPLALTGYLVWAAVVAGETLLHAAIDWLFAELGLQWTYVPGMGFVLSVALVLAVGLLMYSFVVRAIYQRFTAMLSRIPIIKSVYGLLVDVVQLFNKEASPFHKVVRVQLPGSGEVLGFLTRENFDDMPGFAADRVAVYLPMSYQLGGFTLIVPRSSVQDVAMTAEEALRFCVTAGVARRAVQGSK